MSRSSDTSNKTAQLARLILEIGPDIPEIARRLGEYKESVRYRYKAKILNKGFSIQVAVDYQKLGIKRVVLLITFAPEYRDFAHSIMTAMSELCYVTHFEKRLLHSGYVMHASVPANFVQRFISLMKKLGDIGLFSSVEAIVFDWFRIVPMAVEQYNFDSGRWDFDWSLTRETSSIARYLPSEQVAFDKTDLLILKELQIDSTQTLAEIASKLSLGYKKLDWHYKKHVLGRELVAGYYLRWMGTKYDSKLERVLHKAHRYLQIDLLAQRLNEIGRMALVEKIHRLPFLWSEAVGQKEYYCEIFIPTENATEALQYLTELIEGVEDEVQIMMMDQTEAVSFTLPYQLYNKDTGEWMFDDIELISRFENMMVKIKEIGGGQLT